ncbi:MAG: hypothetical protein MUO21_10660 [Nitrososphaeraceae archaeon]|nr:hypothetical protein [Nitrososphaeraceae archaeon]
MFCNGGSKWWHFEQGDYTNADGDTISQDNRTIDGINVPGLDNEIMTAWGTDKQPVISTVTIANLEDLGYQVNYDEADVSHMDNLDVNKEEKEKEIIQIINDPEPYQQSQQSHQQSINFIPMGIISFMIIFIIMLYYLLFSSRLLYG